jgi:hypothetical protein
MGKFGTLKGSNFLSDFLLHNREVGTLTMNSVLPLHLIPWHLSPWCTQTSVSRRSEMYLKGLLIAVLGESSARD